MRKNEYAPWELEHMAVAAQQNRPFKTRAQWKTLGRKVTAVDEQAKKIITKAGHWLSLFSLEQTVERNNSKATLGDVAEWREA